MKTDSRVSVWPWPVKATPIWRSVSWDGRSHRAHKPLTGTLKPRAVAVSLGSTIAMLVFAHVTVKTLAFITKHNGMFGLVHLFDLDAEQNIPTLFSTGLLLMGALLSTILWKASRAEGLPERMWFVLAVAFTLLGVDEFCALHEGLVAPVRSTLHTTGLLYFAWVVPYGLATAATGLAAIPFLRRLDPLLGSHISCPAWCMSPGPLDSKCSVARISSKRKAERDVGAPDRLRRGS